MPKQLNLDDLSTFVTTWWAHNENLSIVVMVDVNSDTSDPHLKSFIADTDIHNIVTHRSPDLIN